MFGAAGGMKALLGWAGARRSYLSLWRWRRGAARSWAGLQEWAFGRRLGWHTFAGGSRGQTGAVICDVEPGQLAAGVRSQPEARVWPGWDRTAPCSREAAGWFLETRLGRDGWF